MSLPPNEKICDWTECPHCVRENAALGGGHGYADYYFNAQGGLWAACAVHLVRWYVTREMFGFPEDLAGLLMLPRVETDYARGRLRSQERLRP